MRPQDIKSKGQNKQLQKQNHFPPPSQDMDEARKVRVKYKKRGPKIKGTGLLRPPIKHQSSSRPGNRLSRPSRGAWLFSTELGTMSGREIY